jgi:hypothetical protein
MLMRSFRRHGWGIGAIGGALVLACSNVAEPRHGGPVVLLPTTFFFGPCAISWTPSTPNAARTVVDFYYGVDGTGPTAEQIDAVQRAGGTNVYTFNVPKIRAEVDVSTVPSLVGLGLSAAASYAMTVPDTMQRTDQLIVELTHPVTDADVAALEALGGRVGYRYTVINGYSAEIDDAAVPQLRALSGVQLVEVNALACAD